MSRWKYGHLIMEASLYVYDFSNHCYIKRFSRNLRKKYWLINILEYNCDLFSIIWFISRLQKKRSMITNIKVNEMKTNIEYLSRRSDQYINNK